MHFTVALLPSGNAAPNPTTLGLGAARGAGRFRTVHLVPSSLLLFSKTTNSSLCFLSSAKPSYSVVGSKATVKCIYFRLVPFLQNPYLWLRNNHDCTADPLVR